MSSRNQQRGNRQDSNFSRRGREENPSQWTAYGRSESGRSEMDHDQDRDERSQWGGSDYERSHRNENDYRGSSRSFSSGSDYDTSRDSRSRDNRYRGGYQPRENQEFGQYGGSSRNQPFGYPRGEEGNSQMDRYNQSYQGWDNRNMNRNDRDRAQYGTSQGSNYDRSSYGYGNGGFQSYDRHENTPESSDMGGGYSAQQFMHPNSQSSSYGRQDGGSWGSSSSWGGSSNRQQDGAWGSSAGRQQDTWGNSSSGSNSQNSQFSGRGPKAYKRSDERIKEELCEMLTRDHAIDAQDIDVEVKDGEVTLTGSVPERRMKHMAEDCVERCMGVKDVTNNIRVKRDMSSSDTSSGSATGDRTSSGKKSASGSSSSTLGSNH